LSREAKITIAIIVVGAIASTVFFLTANRAFGGASIIAGFALSAIERIRKPTPSQVLQDEKAAEELAERQAQAAARAAEEALREQRESKDRRLMLLRDLGRIRKAILLELEKLSPPEPLIFGWGGRQNTAEERRYWFEDDRFMLRLQHDGGGSTWDWPEGGLPQNPTRARPYDPANLDDVEAVYSLFQPERYVVAFHIPEDPLEGEEPGYGRFAAPSIGQGGGS
jgi:hypothetical protein